MNNRVFDVSVKGTCYCIGFDAMASPCEVLIETDDAQLVDRLAQQITAETWRIEDKFSRYNPNSLVSKINKAMGKSIPIDLETFRLLEFANECFLLTDGLFDITSGLLRKVWQFDGSNNIPKQSQINALLPQIDWQQVRYTDSSITLPAGMEIDFGGIGKEYAVDKVVQLIAQTSDAPVLVNFGGDLCASKARKNNEPWVVGIELKGIKENTETIISFSQGGIATSGDANRYLLKDNVRYSHILNPKTGWPVQGSANSITVASHNCVQAGMIATISMLLGKDGQDFLEQNGFKYWLFNNQ